MVHWGFLILICANSYQISIWLYIKKRLTFVVFVFILIVVDKVTKDRARQKGYSFASTHYIGERRCVICGATKRIDGHHEDYSKPHVIIWLCKKHHFLLHRYRRQDDKRSPKRIYTQIRHKKISTLEEIKYALLDSIVQIEWLHSMVRTREIVNNISHKHRKGRSTTIRHPHSISLIEEQEKRFQALGIKIIEAFMLGVEITEKKKKEKEEKQQ